VGESELALPSPQRGGRGLAPVVRVDADKCRNCHACIAACPVKYCNVASGEVVEINSDRCIACGCCIDACTHSARLPVDDWDAFWSDLQAGVKIVAVVAPAVVAAFPHRYQHLNGWLKSAGVRAAFDVSLGAELTVQSYLRHIQEDQPRTVVAQPCPAIVNYIELYRPELLPHLAPAGSPMQHSMAMIRRYYPQYADHKIAVISPCIAKKREFEATGLGDYNVTMRSLHNYIQEQRIDLARFPQVEFEGPPAERAVLFSSPGGLRDTLERWNADAARATRKIEGPRTVYAYLDELPQALKEGCAPLLIDCLNCEKGCNGGTGTPARKLGHDRIEFLVAERARQARAHYASKGPRDADAQDAIAPTLQELDEPGLYRREYVNRAADARVRKPGPAELQAIYAQMYKQRQEDFYNCGACGYSTCEGMATAIFNGLNRPENCHYFLASLNQQTERQQTDTLKGVMVDFEQTIAKVNHVAKTTDRLQAVANAILRISNQTHILALNASIEASRAGAAGAAFGVVSKAVRDLARSVRQEAEAIDPCSVAMREAFDTVLVEVDRLAQRLATVIQRNTGKPH